MYYGEAKIESDVCASFSRRRMSPAHKSNLATHPFVYTPVSKTSGIAWWKFASGAKDDERSLGEEVLDYLIEL